MPAHFVRPATQTILTAATSSLSFMLADRNTGIIIN
jgi:hypothetical protein